MGAGNSTPQTVRLDNPQRVVPIQITPSVLSRLEESQKQQQQQQQQQENNSNENVDETMKQPKVPEEPSKIPETPPENNEQHLQNSYIHPGHVQETPHYWWQTNEELQQKFNENEEDEFDKTLVKLEEILGKPVGWIEEFEEEIKGKRAELIKCYSEHPGRTLCCSDIANEYQQLIFREQYRSILKFNAGLQEQEAPQPPHQHSPPYN